VNAPHRAPYYQLAANVPGFPRVGGSEPAFVGARLRPTMRANWRVIASRPGSDGRVNWLPFSIASAPVPGCNSGPTSAVFPGPHHLLKAGFRVGKTKVQMAEKKLMLLSRTVLLGSRPPRPAPTATSRICSNDPICADHQPGHHGGDHATHGAACHGCLLIAETSCEMRNLFFDDACTSLLLVWAMGAFCTAAFPVIWLLHRALASFAAAPQQRACPP
jgi:hypothetical protein